MKRPSVLRPTSAVFGALWAVACSGSNPTLPSGIVPEDAGPSERGIVHEPDAPVSEAGRLDGSDVRSNQDGKDAPLSGDATAIDAGKPAKVLVTILTPSATTGIDGGVIDGGTVTPVLSKADRLAPIVQIELQSQGGDSTLDVLTSVRATLTQAGATKTGIAIALNQTQFSVLPGSDSRIYIYSDTPFDLSSIVGDYYDLAVNATTVAGATGSAAIRVYIDAGPKITFLQPVDGAYVKGSVVVTAMVVDSSAALASVTWSIGQWPIDPKLVSNSGSQYSTVIDFGSYNPPLDGVQVVTATATNANGNVSVATRKFIVDNDGPAITATKPVSGGFIGKIITIEAKVDDPASVMKSSVIAVVAHGKTQLEVKLMLGADGVYRNLFDTTQLPSYALFPSISFRAQDVLGNQSQIGYVLWLDNTPPIIDLDPPAQVRLVRNDRVCSQPFDPVGPDAIDDGAVVTQLFDIRARIEDDGNTPLTGTADLVPIAAVDPATVKLLILDDTSLPLVVDTSDPPDGICDDVNPELVPSVSPKSSKEAQLIDMVSMPPKTGQGDFRHDDGASCSTRTPGGDPPKALCDTTCSETKGACMTYSLSYSSGLPSIWTVGPIVVGDWLRCAGNQFDASNNLTDGWACVAVVAADKMGNKQVSRPIRICVVASPDSKACTLEWRTANPPPNCTGTVVKSTTASTVDATKPCKPWRSFPPAEFVEL